MQVKVPQLSVQQAGLQTVAVGHLGIGPITVGSLAINNVDFTLASGHGVLQNVQVTVTLKLSVEWHIHVGLPDGIPDIDVGDTYDLGSLSVSLPVGDIDLPALSNLKFDIPSLAAQNLSVNADPLSLQIKNVKLDTIRANDVALPSGGFTISGLSFGSLSAAGIGVPAASVAQATVQHVHGDPALIPAFTLGALQLPTVQIPSISSTIPLTIPANLETVGAGFDAGILRVIVRVQPSVLMHVEHLQITNASASAAVGQVVLQNVTLPFDALNVTLSQIGIDTIEIPNFTVA
jgi:hypothetical protein